MPTYLHSLARKPSQFGRRQHQVVRQFPWYFESKSLSQAPALARIFVFDFLYVALCSRSSVRRGGYVYHTKITMAKAKTWPQRRSRWLFRDLHAIRLAKSKRTTTPVCFSPDRSVNPTLLATLRRLPGCCI